jgi:hypothetical protein
MDLKVGKTQENLCCEMKPLFLTTITSLIGTVLGFVHPIAIHGRYFIDSVTREPFFVKGVDYQPGGSAAVSEYQDPLSDRDICARDVILFQDLGINVNIQYLEFFSAGFIPFINLFRLLECIQLTQI